MTANYKLKYGRRMMKQAVVAELCAVAYYEDRNVAPGPDNVFERPVKGREMVTVGFAYPEILGRLRAEFPGCNVSLGALRWYATQMRGSGALVEEMGERVLPRRRLRTPCKPARDRRKAQKAA